MLQFPWRRKRCKKRGGRHNCSCVIASSEEDRPEISTESFEPAEPGLSTETVLINMGPSHSKKGGKTAEQSLTRKKAFV